MQSLLSAGWWNGVAALISIVSLSTPAIAFVAWVRYRYRFSDGFISFDAWRDGSGVKIRVQNTGGTMCEVVLMFVRNLTLDYVDESSHVRALPPGSGALFAASGVDGSSEMVVFYTTVSDARRVHVARFLPGEPKDDLLSLESAGHISWLARREMRFRYGDALFAHSGYARIQRIIPTGRGGTDRDLWRYYVNHLLSEGYGMPFI